jgi:ABC-2 type transport system ATP-binding protein
MTLQGVPAVRTIGLSRRFGDVWAVREMNLEIARGSIVGVLGPNGAGKTTTLGLMCGLLEPTAGRVEIYGIRLDTDPEACRLVTGVVHERLNLHEHLTAREHLEFVGLAYGLPRRLIERRSRELLELLGLVEWANRPITSYSHGTMKKTALASALIVRPRLLLLDEPFEGLDPIAAKVLAQNLKALARGGAAILITSHILERMEKLCERIVLVRDGAVAMDSAVTMLVDGDAAHPRRDLESAVFDALGRSVDERDVLSWMEHEV